MGCMVGRLALNNTWEISRIDSTFYPESEQTMSRRQILQAYAEFCQAKQDQEMAKGGKLSNTILIKPIVNLFVGEFKGADFRKHMNQQAASKQFLGRVRDLIHHGIEYYAQFNEEALDKANGERQVMPTHMLLEELKLKQEIEKVN